MSRLDLRRQRRFTLRLQPTPARDGWGFSLEEVFGDRARRVLRVAPRTAAHYRRDVIEAVAATGYPRTAVGPTRRKPFELTQDRGVRLALTVSALAPLRDPLRRLRVHERICSMSSEEALYWYAQTDGTADGCGLRALRILAAGK